MIKNITDNDFEQEVIQAEGLVIVDFWASWCGPCRTLAPILGNVAEQQPQIPILKLDVDANPAVAGQYGIMGIPTLLFFKGGKVVDRLMGVSTNEDIVLKIKGHG